MNLLYKGEKQSGKIPRQFFFLNWNLREVPNKKVIIIITPIFLEKIIRVSRIRVSSLQLKVKYQLEI